MEIFLFVMAFLKAFYYGILLLFTDTQPGTRLYWPVTALCLFFVGILLHIDKKRKAVHKRFLPLELRTFCVVSIAIYYIMLLIMAFWMLFAVYHTESADCDYLILAENDDTDYKLSEGDKAALDRVINYMTKHPETKVVLAGSSRFDLGELEETSILDLMIAYLGEHHISHARIMTERISNNIRQNINYSYAYIVVDWYSRTPNDYEMEPVVGFVMDTISLLRYRMIIGETGRNVEILTYADNALVLPARFIEELQLLLYYHLDAAFAK